MPTDEQKKQYNANRAAKRAKDKYEALPETRALRGELDALKKSIAGEQVYMQSAEHESNVRESAEMWKSAYERVMAEQESEVRLGRSNLKFLIAEQAKMADRIDAAFNRGMAAGRELMAEQLKEAKEELAIVEGELEEAMFGVADDTDEEMEDNIFVNPNDSPSRSPKKKKKKKGKWGGDRCSAAYRASHNVGSPARPTGHKQVI